MSEEIFNESVKSKLTKGDKCILIHIAVTLLFILILIIIYVAHIVMVKHEGLDDYIRITRRHLDLVANTGAVNLSSEVPSYRSIGIAFIQTSPPRSVCNTVLVKHQWSLAPAHCVTIRSDPDLAQLLPKWRIKYKEDGQDKETDVKRGIVHSYFNKDDFDNNIGLFEHFKHILIPEFIFPKSLVVLMKNNTEDRAIVSWNKKGDGISSNQVWVLSSLKCSQFVFPIVGNQRQSELCVRTRDLFSTEAVHGGAFVMNSQIVGFFSWGDRSGDVPKVVLAIEPYKNWIQSMLALNV